jgi:hypothetical protein
MLRHDLKAHDCLNCGHVLNAATATYTDDGPKPEDLSVCIGCGYVMVYAEDMSFRELSESEREELKDSEHGDMVRKYLQIISERDDPGYGMNAILNSIERNT